MDELLFPAQEFSDYRHLYEGNKEISDNLRFQQEKPTWENRIYIWKILKLIFYDDKFLKRIPMKGLLAV